MQAIVTDIHQIIENGHGYASGGDVFFDVASMPAYGELSGRKQVPPSYTAATTKAPSMPHLHAIAL